MKNKIILISSCLLLASSHVYADRPAMMDSSTISKPIVETPQALPMVETGTVVEMPAVVMQPTELHPGETLNIKLLDSPKRGMSMSTVRNELGSPDSVSKTVGNPPITSWSYTDRVVYFEHSYVIHVVPR